MMVHGYEEDDELELYLARLELRRAVVTKDVVLDVVELMCDKIMGDLKRYIDEKYDKEEVNDGTK